MCWLIIEPRDLYDACTDTFLHRNVHGPTSLDIPADSAVLLVLPPSGGKLTRQEGRTLVNGVVIDHRRSVAPAANRP